MSSPPVSLVLKTGPRCADDQTDLWCSLCKPFAPCELGNQRLDFRIALGQRLSSLCYLIANFHRLFSFTCSTFFLLCVFCKRSIAKAPLDFLIYGHCSQGDSDIPEEYRPFPLLTKNEASQFKPETKRNYNRLLQQFTHKS